MRDKSTTYEGLAESEEITLKQFIIALLLGGSIGIFMAMAVACSLNNPVCKPLIKQELFTE